MEPIAIVTVLALLQLFLFSYLTGRERVRHGIKAPAITGHPEFERAFRVHQNSVEQLVIFIPALWLFGHYANPLIGTGLGLLFVVSRFLYRSAYLRNPSTRTAGFAIGALAMTVLMLGGLIGAVMAWLPTQP